MTDGSNSFDWAEEYQAVSQVTDLARNPDDFLVTRQSAVTIPGHLFPVTSADRDRLNLLFGAYEAAFAYYHQGVGAEPQQGGLLTATMRVMMKRAAERTKAYTLPPAGAGFNYISLDPRDYTTFCVPDIGDAAAIRINTSPDQSWFLGVMRFGSALGMSLGRMRVSWPSESPCPHECKWCRRGAYSVTLRTKWRALTNKVKQEEVRDAYRRLIQK